MMADEPKQPIVTDPDNVPEILCDGQFNIFVNGQFATLTFTHVRPDSTSMFRGGAIDQIATVRARIVAPIPNLIALRDLLNRVIQDPSTPVPPAGGTQH
jgi:hypothetical protein